MSSLLIMKRPTHNEKYLNYCTSLFVHSEYEYPFVGELDLLTMLVVLVPFGAFL